jgi:hypothetical protein
LRLFLQIEQSALRMAVETLEHPRLAVRLAEIAGKPIELDNRALPETASKAIALATTQALNADVRKWLEAIGLAQSLNRTISISICSGKLTTRYLRMSVSPVRATGYAPACDSKAGAGGDATRCPPFLFASE